MTKDIFDKIVKKAGKSPILVAGSDNIYGVFYINTEGSYCLQDDDCVYCIKVNYSGASPEMSQQNVPYHIMVIEYDDIKVLKIMPDVDTLKEFLDGKTPATGETLEDIKKEILKSSVMNASSPRGYTTNNMDNIVNNYGKFTGVGLTMGTEADPYLKAVKDKENGTP